MSEWKLGRLADFANVLMGTSPPGETTNETGTGTPLLNGPTEFTDHAPVAVQFTTLPVKLCEPGDILFCVRGSTTGRMNWADQQYAIGRGLAAIRHRDGNEYQPYVRAVIEYALPSLLAVSTGSTFPSVSRADIENVKVTIPPLPEQRAIACILGTLDDKIELNRKRCRTLEAMARAIFQSWFVDFDPVHENMRRKASRRRQSSGQPGDNTRGLTSAARFDDDDAPTTRGDGSNGFRLSPEIAALFPDSFEDSPLGPIPKGWRVGTVGNHFRLTMGQSPPGETYNESGEGMPFYQGRTDFGFRFPTRRVFCTAPTRIAEPGDTLVSVRAPVGDVNMAIERCAIGRGLAAVRHQGGSRSLTYYAMQNLGSHFDTFEAEGTVFGSINKTDFEKLPFLECPEALFETFEQIVAPIDMQIENLECENVTLAALRDALLPKLISGELRVPDAERIVGRAT